MFCLLFLLCFVLCFFSFLSHIYIIFFLCKILYVEESEVQNASILLTPPPREFFCICQYIYGKERKNKQDTKHIIIYIAKYRGSPFPWASLRSAIQWRSRGYCRPGPNIYGCPYGFSRNTFASEIAALSPPPPPLSSATAAIKVV